MSVRKSWFRGTPGLKRALASVLAVASLAAVTGGCAGTSGDYWRERPASSNYQRLPIR
jgi:hypothetical protein